MYSTITVRILVWFSRGSVGKYLRSRVGQTLLVPMEECWLIVQFSVRAMMGFRFMIVVWQMERWTSHL